MDINKMTFDEKQLEKGKLTIDEIIINRMSKNDTQQNIEYLLMIHKNLMEVVMIIIDNMPYDVKNKIYDDIHKSTHSIN